MRDIGAWADEDECVEDEAWASEGVDWGLVATVFVLGFLFGLTVAMYAVFAGGLGHLT